MVFTYFLSKIFLDSCKYMYISGPDPGFSVGGGRGPIFGGFWPPMWALFSKNVCENERIGSCRGACASTPPRSTYAFVNIISFHVAYVNCTLKCEIT